MLSNYNEPRRTTIWNRVLPDRDVIVPPGRHGWPCRPLPASLFGDVEAALRERDPATLSTAVTFAALAEFWVCGHRDIHSRGITDCRLVVRGRLPGGAWR